LVKNVFIEEEQCAKGLILGGRGHMAVHCKIREEFVDFGFGHLGGVAFVVEENEAACPVVIGIFGANGVMADAAGVAKAIEEFGRFGRRSRRAVFFRIHTGIVISAVAEGKCFFESRRGVRLPQGVSGNVAFLAV
jgi:hypothetical protein